MSMPAAARQTTPSIRVMVVDDSAVVRGFIVRILEAEPGIDVVATCAALEHSRRVRSVTWPS